jgi:hypothetical protein
MRPIWFCCVRCSSKPQPLCDWAERWEFWNDAFSRHGLSPADAGNGIADINTAFEVAHKLYAHRRGATIWGDKSPNYYDRLNEMADDFPEARFIIVWRDPKAAANSILRSGSLGNSFFSRKGAAFCGLLGYETFKRECDRLRARGKAVCEVNYEDLIADTPLEMRRICDFLQIPYLDSLASLEGADRSAVLDGQHHANFKGDKIVRGPRPELVGADLLTQILGYVASWRQRYGDWPAHPAEVDPAVRPTSGIARLRDRLLYRALRIRDGISPTLFSFAPIALLRRYRERKARRRAESQTSCVPGTTAEGEASL